MYAESGLPLTFEDGAEAPAWMDGWNVIRADKAGTVFYHLLTYNKAPAKAEIAAE